MAQGPGSSRLGLAPFRYPSFRLLWAASVWTNVASGMEQLAIGWVVLEMTDSPLMVGASFAARMAPFFFLGLPAGALADRIDRRLLLRLAIGGRVAVAVALGLLLASEMARAWHVLALAALSGGLWAATQAARQAYTYDLVGHGGALAGLALNDLAQRVGGVAGALLAGFLVAKIGAGPQYLVTALCYGLGLLLLARLRERGVSAPMYRGPVLAYVADSLRLVSRRPTLQALMLMASVTEVLGFSHQALLPVFARDVLGVGAQGLGYMLSVRQAGGVAALLALAAMGGLRGKGAVLLAVTVAYGVGLMAFWRVDQVWLFLGILTLVNACAAAVDALYKTLMQEAVPNEERGLAMGAWVLSLGTGPAGHLGLGALAAALGAPGALLMAGSGLALAGVAAAFTRLRRLP